MRRDFILGMILVTSFAPCVFAQTPAELLAKQIETARRTGNVSMQIDALKRLILIDRNPMNRVELLRVELEAGRTTPAKSQKEVADICALGNTYACDQARELITNTGVVTQTSLQRINLYAKAGQYQKALDLMDKTYGGVPKEESLKLYYYELMLKIPSRQKEAAQGLASLVNDPSVNSMVRNKAEALYRPAEVDQRSEEIHQKIASDRSRSEGLRELDTLMKANPNSERTEEWKKLHSEGSFWDSLYEARNAVRRGDAYSVNRYLAAAEKVAPPQEKYNINLVRASQLETQLKFKEARAQYDAALKLAQTAEAKNTILRLNRENLQREQAHQRSMAKIEAERAKGLAEQKAYQEEKNLPENEENLRMLITRHPSDPYYRFKLAQYYQKQGRNKEARELFSKMPARMLQDNRWGYFYALILEKHSKTEALNALNKIRNPDRDARNLKATLEESMLIAKAQKCYENNNMTCVNKILSSIKRDNHELRILRAKVDLANGKTEDAKQFFAELEKDANHRVEALLEGAGVLIAEGDKEGAIEKLREIPSEEKLTPDRSLYAAHLYERADEPKEALRYLKQLEEESDSANLTNDQRLYIADMFQRADEPEESVVFLKKVEPELEKDNLTTEQRIYLASLYEKADEPKEALRHLKTVADAPGQKEDRIKANTAYAQALAREGERDEALRAYKKAFHIAGLTKKENPTNAEFTEAMRIPNADEVEYRKKQKENPLVKDATDLYLDTTPTLTVGAEVMHKDGESGSSELTRTTTMVRYQRPLWNGVLTLKGDYVIMDTGSLNKGATGQLVGTCFSTGCGGQSLDDDEGVSIAVAYKKDNWEFDIGTTPLGFLYNNIVGGLSYTAQLDDAQSVTGTVYRRAKRDSLLAYGGQKDPNPAANGAKYGGVVRTGVRLDYSNEFDPLEGIWARVGYEVLRGHNVRENSAAYAMAGYYQRLIYKTNEQWQVGANVMAMKYDNNQDQYTWGNGGYFSPQRYLSFGINTEYRWRNPLWSVQLGAELGYAFSKTKTTNRYNERGKIHWASSMDDLDALKEGETTNGVKYAVNAIVERRLSSRLVAGLSVDVKHSPNWKPISGMLYLRYSFDDWKGSLPMPPKPPIPYSELDPL